MKISVIIPVHNRALLATRAVKSVLDQTLEADEIIVVDDGSSDDLSAQLFRLKSDRLSLIWQEHKGVSAARNLGIEHSSNSWLAFLDSDDYWLPEKLARQAEELSRSPELSISQTDEVWIRNGRRVNPRKYHEKMAGDIFKPSLDRCMVSPSSVILKRSLFDEVGRFDTDLPACEDYDLWLRISSKYEVGLIKEKLVVKTGGHADQLSARYWGMDRFRVKSLVNILQADLLRPDQKEATISILEKKLSILKAGAAKRGKSDESKEYQRLLDRHCVSPKPATIAEPGDDEI